MKAFFEEYGFVMLSAVVIVTLITIATGLKGTVEDGIKDVMTGFKSQIVNESKELVVPTIGG